MKFQATVVYEFQATSIADAGEKLNGALRQSEADDMEARLIELKTPPDWKAAVTLPGVGGQQHSLGPRAAAVVDGG
jgi:hypothetical protein